MTTFLKKKVPVASCAIKPAGTHGMTGMSNVQDALLGQYVHEDAAPRGSSAPYADTCGEGRFMQPGAIISSASSAMTGMSALQAALVRPYLTTEEAADLLRVRPQTLRSARSRLGAYGTIKPFKVKGTRRLYWPTAAVLRMIEEAA